MKKSVVRKLFLVTSLLILSVFSLVMVAEGLFFEQFYRTSKINSLEQNVDQFTKQIQEKEISEQQIARMIGQFMNQNDVSASILNAHFERIPLNPYFLEVKTEDRKVEILIPSEGMKEGDIPKGISTGDTLVIDGFFLDEKDTIMQPVNIQPQDTDLEEGLARIKGTVTDFMLPENRSYNPLYQDTLINEALGEWLSNQDLYQSQIEEGALIQVDWSDKWSGVDYAFVILPFSTIKNEQLYLFTMTSMQPVGEAVGILKRYFGVAAPIILVLVMFLSLVYSRIVSRPLLELNRSASRLAKLDFTMPPVIRSKDEFGELSNSMIELSLNLDAALKELKLANVHLEDEVKVKQRAEQLRKEFIANISHELKTPLGIIKGFAEGLQDGVASEKRERYLTLIVNETDRMNALIMDMLELSKYEVNSIKLKHNVFNLDNLIHKVADPFLQKMEEKRLKFKMNKESGVKTLVWADSRRIEQVLLNLMSNAIRHAKENSIITVDIRRSPLGKITTVIENVGHPIAEKDLGRIWDQFYRAERSRDRKFGGTGLGLAIVKHILDLHECDYGAMNTNQGVAFYFTLNESREKLHE